MCLRQLLLAAALAAVTTPVGVARAQGDTAVLAIEALTIPLLDWRFSPAEITLTSGSNVTWSTTGLQEHTATADDGSFSGAFVRGRPFAVTFATPGVYPYLCTPHPWMRGSVTVIAAEPLAPEAKPAAESSEE